MNFETVQPENLYDRFRYLFSLSPNAFSGSQILRAFQAQTEARLATTAIALHRYASLNQRYPENLEALVLDFLPALPIDPMDGKLMKYRLIEPKQFLLYSSGVDAEDNHGSDEFRSDKGWGLNLWSTSDAIWPRLKRPDN